MNPQISVPPTATSVSRSAPTLQIRVPDAVLAYRDFGPRDVGPPLVFMQRFRGTMDHWDAELLDGIAARRRVILFDSKGVGRSEGEPVKSIAEQARVAADLLRALDITSADAIGWSMGGAAAQVLALDYPQLVRRLIVAGSSPGGVVDAPKAPEKVWEVAGKPVNDDEDFLYLFYHDSNTSRAAGIAQLGRLASRGEPFSPPVDGAAIGAQLGAIGAWAAGKDSALARLGSLGQPVLVANGQFDRMVHAYNSYVMAQKSPNAKLILYPDSGHAFLFQHHAEFAADVLRFLAD